MDCSPPVSSVLGILQARILEWLAMPSVWARHGTVLLYMLETEMCFWPYRLVRTLLALRRVM